MSDPSLLAGRVCCLPGVEVRLAQFRWLPLCAESQPEPQNRPSVSKGVYVSLLSLFGYLYSRRPLSPRTHPGLEYISQEDPEEAGRRLPGGGSSSLFPS